MFSFSCVFCVQVQEENLNISHATVRQLALSPLGCGACHSVACHSVNSNRLACGWPALMYLKRLQMCELKTPNPQPLATFFETFNNTVPVLAAGTSFCGMMFTRLWIPQDFLVLSLRTYLAFVWIELQNLWFWNDFLDLSTRTVLSFVWIYLTKSWFEDDFLDSGIWVHASSDWMCDCRLF